MSVNSPITHLYLGLPARYRSARTTTHQIIERAQSARPSDVYGLVLRLLLHFKQSEHINTFAERFFTSYISSVVALILDNAFNMLYPRSLSSLLVLVLFFLDNTPLVLAKHAASDLNHLARRSKSGVPVNIPLRSPPSSPTVSRDLVSFSIEGES